MNNERISNANCEIVGDANMDYTLPDSFIEFELGWYKKYDFEYEANQLAKILYVSKKENDIQRYIKENKKWFIPASIFESYDFGHHEAFIVPEQALGAEYRVDYMLLGRNSIGHQIVLIEFEDVNVDYKIKSANIESDSVRKGIAQIKDWKRWIDSNREYFMNSCGLSNISRNIPTWGINYCLVVGRRSRMDAISNQMRGQSQYEMPALKIMTYDRLVDNVRMLGNGF